MFSWFGFRIKGNWIRWFMPKLHVSLLVRRWLGEIKIVILESHKRAYVGENTVLYLRILCILNDYVNKLIYNGIVIVVYLYNQSSSSITWSFWCIIRIVINIFYFVINSGIVASAKIYWPTLQLILRYFILISISIFSLFFKALPRTITFPFQYRFPFLEL